MTLKSLPKVRVTPDTVFEYLHKTILDIEANSENILSILYKSLTIATDSDIHHIVYYLLQQGVYPFLEMLGKWIYYGIVDDKFDEFMIAEVRPSQRLDNATGIDKFVLKTSRVGCHCNPPRCLTS